MKRLERYRGLIVFALVFLVGCLFTPKLAGTSVPVFLTWRTQKDILYEYSEYGLLATGMTLVILVGGIDLSVGSVLGLTATLFALLTVGHGWGIGPSVLAVLAVGLAVGLLNGILVSRFRLQPFVATLATMTAARGLAKVVTGGAKVQPGAAPWYALTGDTPEFFAWMTRTVPGIGLPPAALLFLIALAVTALIVNRTIFGRHVYAVGGNEEASRLAGIPVTRVKLVTYAACAGLAALAGVVNACRQDLGDPEAGATFELDAIAAVVIGGTSLQGGRGGVWLTLLGVLIVAYINKILSLNALPLGPRMILQAAIIVVAVALQRKKAA
ncbi:MAG TPA: ABC transporter permease [Armatimonadaceae bacterium]|nr:ABC transporter permease [Armatimonadaceae bacterium]